MKKALIILAFITAHCSLFTTIDLHVSFSYIYIQSYQDPDNEISH